MIRFNYIIMSESLNQKAEKTEIQDTDLFLVTDENGKMYKATKVTLGSELGAEGAVTEEQLDEAIDECKDYTDQQVSAAALGGGDVLIPILYTKSKNLFDESKANTDNIKINSSGAEVSGTGCGASDFIPVLEGQDVFVTGYYASTSNYYAFYDESKAFISGGQQTVATPPFPVEAPAGATYFRFTFNIVHVGMKWIQVEIGDHRTPYEPFGIIKSSDDLVPVGTGLNVINPDEMLAMSANTSTGALTTNSGNYITQMIKVSAGETFMRASAGTIHFFEYDENQVFVKYTAVVANVNPFVISEGTEYIRIMIVASALGTTIERNRTAPFITGYSRPFTKSLDIPINPKRITEAVPGAQQEFIFPKKLFLVKSALNNIFMRPALRRKYPNDFYFRMESGAFNYEKSAFVTPTANSTMTAVLYNRDFDKVQQATISVVVGDMTKSTGSPIIHPIGDSITDINSQYKYISDNCTGTSFVGTYKDPISSLEHDGRTGWTLGQYMTTIHSPAEWAGFSPFLHPQDTYRYLGCTRFWIAAYDPGSTYAPKMKWKAEAMGGFDSTTGIPDEPEVNDLIYHYSASKYKAWNGSEWEEVSEGSLTFEFNYARFLEVWDVDTPTDVMIMLGTNDYGQVNWLQAKSTTNPNFITWFTTMIESIHEVDSDIRIALIIPPPHSSGDNTTNNWSEYQDSALWEQRKMMVTTFGDMETDKVYLLDLGTAVDPDNDFTKDGSGKVTDSTHPASSGFTNMGKRLAAYIQALR